jgi:Fe-S-cluster containining protein
LSDDEQRRLDRLAGIRRVNFREVRTSRDLSHAGWLLAFAEQPDERCPFLDVSSNLCSIYADRPKACRDFPRAPTRDCLVFPAE